MKTRIALFLALSFIFSCKKTGPQGPEGPAGPPGEPASGTVSGKVKQYSADGEVYSTGLNTVTVTLNGSLTAVTDASGSYTVSNVPAGVYEVRISKNGAGTVKMQQITFPGNGNLIVNGTISDKASYSFSSGSLRDSLAFNNKAIYVNAALSPTVNTGTRYAILLFSKTSNINPADPSTYETGYSIYVNAGSSQINTLVYYSYMDLYNYFQKGTTAFVKLFPATSYHGNYYDFTEEKTVYPGCGTALASTLAFTVQ